MPPVIDLSTDTPALPAPPPGRTGWPWTTPMPALPPRMASGAPWPKISIVTISYNQAQFLEETLRSIALQGYPNLEYIVIDGASTDGSPDLIRRYERFTTYWLSEKDRGQCDGINKGFARATGDIYGFINSDDFLEPGALQTVAEEFSRGAQWLCGDVRLIEAGKPDGIIHPQAEARPYDWFTTNPIPQPGCFYSGQAARRAGMFDTSIPSTFDYEMWMRLRFNLNMRLKVMPQTLAVYRLHSASKTMNLWDSFYREFWATRRRYGKHISATQRFSNRLAERRWYADYYQRQALSAAASGKPGAWKNFRRSLSTWPPVAFQRRTAGAIRRLLAKPSAS